MTCREVIEFLMNYLDGEITPEERRVFDGHLCDCPECVAYIETYKLTIRVSPVAYAIEDDNPAGCVPEKLVRAILAARPKQP